MRAAALIAIAALAGCATPALSPQEEAERVAPLTCAIGPDCDAKWEAAQLWIVKHAGFKLQTVTNVVLQTYGPSTVVEQSTSLAVTVTREPDSPGRYRIWVRMSCGNPFGCTPEALPSNLDFKRAVGAATPP